MVLCAQGDGLPLGVRQARVDVLPRNQFNVNKKYHFEANMLSGNNLFPSDFSLSTFGRIFTLVDRFRDSLQPLVTSHLYKRSLQDQFFMQGTMDHTPFISAKAGLEFYVSLGGREALTAYTRPLLDWAQQMLSLALGTSILPVPASMVAPFMRVLR